MSVNEDDAEQIRAAHAARAEAAESAAKRVHCQRCGHFGPPAASAPKSMLLCVLCASPLVELFVTQEHYQHAVDLGIDMLELLGTESEARLFMERNAAREALRTLIRMVETRSIGGPGISSDDLAGLRKHGGIE